MIYRGETETRSKLLHEALRERVIGTAIEVPRVVGPGLQESALKKSFDLPRLHVYVVK